MPDRGAEILLVEDNPGDQLLAKEAFRRAQWANELYIVDNGRDALRFLHREGDFRGVPRPDLIVLDLNLPGMGGGEVLSKIKWDRKLADIPVVIFSTSSVRMDVVSSYSKGAVCYLRKPIDIDAYFRALDNLEGLFHMAATRGSRVGRWFRRRSRIGDFTLAPRLKREALEWFLITLLTAGAVAFVIFSR